jgi:PleD family two-component response regulator
MSRKRPTQVELEQQVSDLKRQVQQLQKRLKQSLRQLRNHEDIELDNRIVFDIECEDEFNDMLAGRKPELEPEKYMTFTLPDGSVKKVLRRTSKE